MKKEEVVEKKKIEKKPSTTKIEKVKVPKSPFNQIPSPPEHLRPAPVLFAWGAGNFGQFGMGDEHLGEFEKPTRNKLVEQKMQEGVFGDEGAGLEAVAAGGMYSLFIDEQGTVWSCGTNDDAALGRITSDVPDPEKEGEFLDIDTLTAQPFPLQTLKDEGFRAIRVAAGDSISAALSSEGELRVWGSFRSVEGLLGFSNGQKHQFLPVPILDVKSKPDDPEKFTSIAAGNNHLVVLSTHGNIFTWGAGEQGQLGRKVLERRKIHGTTPEKIVLGTRSRKAVAIGAGNYTSFAVDESGTVWAWGLNNMGQTGTGSSESEVQLPTKVRGLSREELDGDTVSEIAGGEHHTVFLTEKGKVYACGRSSGGQLGIAEDDPVMQERDEEHKDMLATPHPVSFPDDDPVVHISAGIHNNLAITKGGAVWTWGTGPQSELGAGDESELKTPKMIVRREGGAWAAVQGSCGGQHTLALLRKKT
ncbi:RCC1/BLIP-II [Trametopsis cervina]|nr:RCC1/BLIP-II [Trametopsis cervina]